MGNAVRRLFTGREPEKFFMQGLDAAGKTTMLNQMKLGKVEMHIPTIGFNVETLTYSAATVVCWDVGGRDGMRPFWRQYMQGGAAALIFVVDSTDRDRLDDAKYELSKTLEVDDMRDALLLVMANKQDLPEAMSAAELCEGLGLETLRNRDWHLQETCAEKGDGILEGFRWIRERLDAQKKQSQTSLTSSLAWQELLNSKFWISLL